MASDLSRIQSVATDTELNAPLLQDPKVALAESRANAGESKKAFLKVVILQVLASVTIFLMQLCSKVGTEMGVGSSQILTIRGYFNLLASIFVIYREKVDLSPIKENKKTLFLRGMFGFGSNGFLTLSFQYLNLSMASVIFNLNPLIAVILGAIFLKEKILKMQIAGLCFTLVGVILLIMPCVFTASCGPDTALNGYIIIPFLSALCRGSVMACVRGCKGMHWTIPTLALTASFCIFSPIIMLITGEYVALDAGTLAILILAAFFGIVSNMFTAQALSIGDMGFNMPITYLSVVLSSFSDVILFGVDIPWNQWVGMGIIFTGIVSVIYVKLQHEKKSKAQKM